MVLTASVWRGTVNIPGHHRGQCEQHSLAYSLHVFDFSLPRISSLRFAFGFDTSAMLRGHSLPARTSAGVRSSLARSYLSENDTKLAQKLWANSSLL